MGRKKKIDKLPIRYKSRGRDMLDSRPKNLEVEVYKYICKHVPFIKMTEVTRYFCDTYEYSSQRLYQVMKHLQNKGYFKRSERGYIALTKRAPVIWGDDEA